MSRSSKRSRSTLVLTLLAGVAIAGAVAWSTGVVANPDSKKAEANPVVAIVDGEKIYKQEVLDFLEEVPAPMKQLPVETLFPLALDQVVNGKVVLDRAAGQKIEETDDFKTQMESARKQILRTLYMEREIGKAVTEDAIQAKYKELVKEAGETQETHARHILLEDEATAKDMIAQLDKGAKFEDLAKEHSTGPSGPKGGDLGYFTKDAMVPEFAEVAFSLEPGSYSKEPVKTQFGWHVILVEDRRAKAPPALEDVRDQLESELRREAFETALKEWKKEASVEMFDMNGKPMPKTPEAN